MFPPCKSLLELGQHLVYIPPGWLIAEKVLNSGKAVGLRISLVLKGSHCRETFRCFQMRLEEGHPYEAVASEVLQAWREHACVLVISFHF